MKTTLCRLLVALMIWAPFQATHAGMIATEQVAARAALGDLVVRADVARELQALGVDPAQVRSRIGAMTDQEVASLAGQIESLPAGSLSNGAAIVLIIVVAAVVWWLWGRR